MIQNTKSWKPLLLAGLAAAAYYAYTKMSTEQKEKIVGTLKQQGKDLLDRMIPAGNNNGTGEHTLNS